MIERHKTPEYYQGCRAMLEYIRPQYLVTTLETKIAECEAEVMDAMAKDACICPTTHRGIEAFYSGCPVHGGAS